MDITALRTQVDEVELKMCRAAVEQKHLLEEAYACPLVASLPSHEVRSLVLTSGPKCTCWRDAVSVVRRHFGMQASNEVFVGPAPFMRVVRELCGDGEKTKIEALHMLRHAPANLAQQILQELRCYHNRRLYSSSCRDAIADNPADPVLDDLYFEAAFEIKLPLGLMKLYSSAWVADLTFGRVTANLAEIEGGRSYPQC
ncbi:MAG: hypothetical protein KVP17_003031 [Porospora cf. gigantea B]|uniref:uncharacterized protein n=1 Tax=Porospora cf. gigantea B TaxID=2853592 RepID=UPI003571CF21|nr:MAG: hypothetical protein KVP17_003031 [Porospora cf. gigantea B]